MVDIDSRLSEWARWVASGRPQLGYSDRSPIHEMVRTGAICHGQGLKPEPEAIEQQKTEAAMQRLRDANPKEHEVVERQYLGKGLQWQKARDLGISEDSFKKLLRSGKVWLSGYFEALDTHLTVRTENAIVRYG